MAPASLKSASNSTPLLAFAFMLPVIVIVFSHFFENQVGGRIQLWTQRCVQHQMRRHIGADFLAKFHAAVGVKFTDWSLNLSSFKKYFLWKVRGAVTSLEEKLNTPNHYQSFSWSFHLVFAFVVVVVVKGIVVVVVIAVDFSPETVSDRGLWWSIALMQKKYYVNI